ncbi:MAG: hypothetical protein AAF799_29585 [Myxococcota bacterium]
MPASALSPFAIGLLTMLLGSSEATERECDEDAFVDSPSVMRGAKCGQWWLVTPPAALAWTFAWARFTTPITGDFDLEVGLQRISRDARPSVEVRMPSGLILFQNGRYAFYENEAQFATDGWTAHPTLETTQPFRVRIEQRRDQVTLWIDGQLAGKHRWARLSTTGDARVAAKSLPQHRGRVRITDPQLRNLQPSTSDAPAPPAR